MPARTPDTLQRFVFEHAPVRGTIVRLDTTWRAVLERRHYPAPVRDLLGELMAAASLLAATIKFDRRLTTPPKTHTPLPPLPPPPPHQVRRTTAHPGEGTRAGPPAGGRVPQPANAARHCPVGR